jgi:type III secretory pathway component EscV/Tfp pilus assembly protein PilF
MSERIDVRAILAGTSRTLPDLPPYDLWWHIDGLAAKADAVDIDPVNALRKRYIDAFLQSECSCIRSGGWSGFLLSLAEAVAEQRLEFATQLCDCAAGLADAERDHLAVLRTAVDDMIATRWARAYRVLRELTDLEQLAEIVRARLVLLLGRIQLFVFSDSGAAKPFYDQALALAPSDYRVLAAMGDYYQATEKPEEAKRYFERALAADSTMAQGYVGLGELREASNDLREAEHWYRVAMEADPGSADVPSKLMQLYRRRELYAEHGPDLVLLAERIVAAEPTAQYQAYVDLASAYGQNQRIEEAIALYEKALALDPRRPDAYVALGQLHAENSRPALAHAAYERGIAAIDGFYEAYRGLISIAGDEQKPEEAAEWRRKLAAAAISALPDAPGGDVTPVRELERVAAEYIDLKDEESARGIYEALRHALGESYEGTYRNWLGNLHYYLDEDQTAVEEYERAVVASPREAVYHRNLAGAYKVLKRYAEAAAAYHMAYELDGNEKSYNDDLALLVNSQANDLFAAGNYVESAAMYGTAVARNPQDVDIWTNLAGAQLEIGDSTGDAEAYLRAIDALEHAQQIDASEAYAQSIAALQRRLRIVRTFGAAAVSRLPVVALLSVEVASDLIPVISENNSLNDETTLRLSELRDAIKNEFGINVPPVQIRDNGSLGVRTYQILLHEVPLVSATIPADRRLFPGPPSEVASLGVGGEKAINPRTGGEAVWVAPENWETLREAKRELWGPVEYLIAHVDTVVRHNLAEFAGHAELDALVASAVPDAAENLKETEGKLTALTAVCDALLSEGLPIQPFADLYAKFETTFAQGSSPHEIVEAIRASVLRTHVAAQIKGLQRVSLGAPLESLIAGNIHRFDAATVLAMLPDEYSRVLAAVRESVKQRPSALVVDDPAIRPFVRVISEFDFPTMPIMSRRELDDHAPPGDDTASRRHSPRDVRALRPASADASAGVAAEALGITVFVNSGHAIDFSIVQSTLFSELGILIPEVRMETDSTLADKEFRLVINGVELPKVEGLASDEYMVEQSAEELTSFGVTARPVVNPANGKEAAILRQSDLAISDASGVGLVTWEPLEYVMLVLSIELRKRATSFVDIEVTRYFLDRLQDSAPALVRSALARFSAEQICRVLQLLLEEEISIRDLRGVLEGLLSVNGTFEIDLSRFIVLPCRTDHPYPASRGRGLADLTVPEYAEAARTSLKRYITSKYLRGASALYAYLLSPEVASRIRESIASVERPIMPEEVERLKAALRTEMASLSPYVPAPVLLTTIDIRRAARNLIADEFPELAVLSFQELANESSLHSLARISFADAVTT